MARVVYIIATTILLSIPSVTLASFLIELNNGSEYLTDRYWPSGNDIQFNYHGGIVSIHEDSILSITETDRPYHEVTPSVDEGSGSGQQSGNQGREAAISEKETDSDRKTEGTEQDVDIEVYRERDSQLKSRLGSSLTSLRDASRNRDEDAKRRAREKIIEYSRRIYELADRLKEKNGGVLPDDWWDDVDKL